MRMPHDPRMIGMCMCCTDKRKAANALEDVKKVRRRLAQFEDMAGIKRDIPSKANRTTKYARLMFTHVHAMCGVCREIDDAQDDIKRVERDIAGSMEGIETFMAGLKENDPKTFESFKRKLMEIFRGTYPHIVRAIERQPLTTKHL